MESRQGVEGNHIGKGRAGKKGEEDKRVKKLFHNGGHCRYYCSPFFLIATVKATTKATINGGL